MAWEAYTDTLIERAIEDDFQTLSYFVNTGLLNQDGSPKPALEIWESFRTVE